MLGCNILLREHADELAKKLDREGGTFEQIAVLSDPIGVEQFNACSQAGDRETARFGEQGMKATILRRRFDATTDFIEATMNEPEIVVIQCKRPDIGTCSIELDPSRRQPRPIPTLPPIG
jgi:hypothetical protein